MIFAFEIKETLRQLGEIDDRKRLDE